MSAGFWAAALRLLFRASTTVRTVILARLLSPDDFGLMAIATLAILLLERFTQIGIDSALVQRSDDIRPYLDTAWTLQIAIAFGTASILALSAPAIAAFFDAPESQAVIQVLAIAVLLRGFVNIGVVTFVKELEFNRFFLFQVAERGTEIVVSITAAIILRNVWALVLGVVASAVAKVIASFIISRYRPRLAWVRSKVSDIVHFGKWILAGNILNYATANIDDILVGRALGVQALGLYRMAYNFSQAVATEVAQVTNQVAFPTYSKLQDSVDRLRAAYLGTLHLVSFVGFPLAIGTILVASDFAIGVLGDQWAPIVVPLQLLAIAGLARGLGATIGPLFQSQGRPEIPPIFSLIKLAIFVVFLYPAIEWRGLDGAAALVAIAATTTGVPALIVAFRHVRARTQDAIQSIVFPALNTLIMVPPVLLVGAVIPRDTFLAFLALAITGVATYGLAVLATSRWTAYRAPSDLIDRIRGAAA